MRCLRETFNDKLLKHALSTGTVIQGVIPCWKCAHRVSGYQGYQEIKGSINGYQEKIDLFSIKYLTKFSRILQNICWFYLNISQISRDSGQRVTREIAESSQVST